jgi:hypothetical protein
VRQNQLDRAILALEHEAAAIQRAIAVLKSQKVATIVKRSPKLAAVSIDRRPS